MTTPQPVTGKHQPHQRHDGTGTFTQHAYEDWGEDMRHQVHGFDVLCRIRVCTRPMPGGGICGHEQAKPIRKER